MPTLYPVYTMEDEGSWLLHSEHTTYQQAEDEVARLRKLGIVARAPRGEERV